MTPEQIEELHALSEFNDSAALRALLAEWESGETMLANLRTEAGKAAFAAANGWPMPEELDAAKRLAEERGREIERLKAEREVLMENWRSEEQKAQQAEAPAGEGGGGAASHSRSERA